MAKDLIKNPVTMSLLNRLSGILQKSPTSVADWFLQNQISQELQHRGVNPNTVYSKVFKDNPKSQIPSEL